MPVEKPRAGGTWTEARFWGFIRSNLRLASRKWPPKWAALHARRRAYSGPDKRRKWEYKCDKCKQWKKGKEVEVDHIVPCGSLKCAADLSGFVLRLFCEMEGFQVLCKSCHGKKTRGKK